MSSVFNGLNSLRPSDAYMRQWIASSLAHFVVCLLSGAKLLSEPFITHCQLDPYEQTPVKFESKWIIIIKNVISEISAELWPFFQAIIYRLYHDRHFGAGSEELINQERHCTCCSNMSPTATQLFPACILFAYYHPHYSVSVYARNDGLPCLMKKYRKCFIWEML